MRTSPFLSNLKETAWHRPLPETLRFRTRSCAGGSPPPHTRGQPCFPDTPSPPVRLSPGGPVPCDPLPARTRHRHPFQRGRGLLSLPVLIGIDLFIISVVLWRKTRDAVSCLTAMSSERSAPGPRAGWAQTARLLPQWPAGQPGALRHREQRPRGVRTKVLGAWGGAATFRSRAERQGCAGAGRGLNP